MTKKQFTIRESVFIRIAGKLVPARVVRLPIEEFGAYALIRTDKRGALVYRQEPWIWKPSEIKR